MVSSQNYPGLLQLTRAAFGFYPEHLLNNKRNVLITFCLRGTGGGEGGFATQWKLLRAQLMLRELQKKATAHCVWQGSQKALGVLCHKHLGFSGWVRLTKTHGDPISNHILLTIPLWQVVRVEFLVWAENQTFVLKGNPPSGFGT